MVTIATVTLPMLSTVTPSALLSAFGEASSSVARIVDAMLSEATLILAVTITLAAVTTSAMSDGSTPTKAARSLLNSSLEVSSNSETSPARVS